MDSSLLVDEIKTQIDSYKEIASSILKLGNMIKYQEKIQQHHVIPKKFKPAQLPTIFEPPNDIMQDKFKQEYNHIFFQHLHEVIVSNKVTLELKKTRMEDILHTTETILLKTTEPPEVAIKEYKNFVT